MFSDLKYHVAAGSFVAAKNDKRILQAFLGTCVGVAMYDAAEGPAEIGLSVPRLPDQIDALPEDLFSSSPDKLFQEATSS